MKLKHMWLALIPLCMASCSEEETIVSGESQREVRVTAGASNHSRVVLNDEGNRISSLWEAGDKISLFTATQSNLVYSTDAHAATATFTPVDEALECREGNTVYACYPDVTKHSEEGMVVNLPSTEVMDYNDGSLRSFGYATGTISNGNVNFQFKHISAFLFLSVTPEMLSDASKGINSVTVSTSASEPLSVGEGDTFDFSTQTISATHGSNTVQVNMDNQVIDSEWTFYIPVLPQPAGADITITLKDSDGQTLYTQTKPTPESGFLAGHTYHQKAVEVANVAYLVDGPTFNERIKELANDAVGSRSVYDEDKLIAKVKFMTEVGNLPEEYITISATDSPAPIYASFNAVDSLLTVFTPAKDIEVENASNMFCNLQSLHTVDFGKFDINETTTDMGAMFYFCQSLTNLDVSKWNTANITGMVGVFHGCSALFSLDVSNWNTANVTDMHAIFSDCSNLTTLDVSKWNTANVTSLRAVFSGCSKVTTLDVSNWSTDKVTDMSSVFSGCSRLTSLDVSNWNTANVTDMDFLFAVCSGITSLDVSNWNTANVTIMTGMFHGCSELSTLDVSKWDTGEVTDMRNLFYGCLNLTTLDVSNWDTSNVASMHQMFSGCSSLSSLDLSSFDSSNVASMHQMFFGCSSLSSLDLSSFDTSNVADMLEMFYDCSSLLSLDLSSFDTSNVASMHQMFSGCSSLSSLDLSGFDTSNVTSVRFMFSGCSSLSSLDLSSFATSNVTDMCGMFSGCSSLSSLDLSSFATTNVTDMWGMFYDCSSLSSLDLSNFDMGHVTEMGAMFNNCASRTKACRVTCTKETKDFLLGKTEDTYMNPEWFIWGDAANGGSSLDEIPKEEW